jgi:hypothetical protein
MALPEKIKSEVLTYCDLHLAGDQWFDGEFNFIADTKLAKRLSLEFYAARYIYKLGEGLAVDGQKLHAHLKFQIMQYASIYEAIIVYLLFKQFRETPAVKKIAFHPVYKPVGKLPANVRLITAQSEELSICAYRKEKTTEHTIKFDDKIGAAVEIGFLHGKLGEEISEFYRLRNGMHLESAVKNQIDYEIKQAKLAYRRMRPFIDGIKAFLKDGSSPKLT